MCFLLTIIEGIPILPIGEEKRTNPRIAGRTKAAYIDLMNNLGLPLPQGIQESLQPNQSAIEDESVKFPTFDGTEPGTTTDSPGSAAPYDELSTSAHSHVREPEEFNGEFGHITGSVLIPLKELPTRANEIEACKNKDVIVVCRAGVRSTTAAAILTGLGFEHVFNLRGGMIDWSDQRLPVRTVRQGKVKNTTNLIFLLNFLLYHFLRLH